jgi:hypothetical protein
VITIPATALADRGTPWKRHVIDDTSKGADGVRLLDVNGDRLPDVATAWEEGGLVRAYLHPGKQKVRQPWPAVTVGKQSSGEDAVFTDVDGDGAFDVVSCHEGKTRAVYVHWAPRDEQKYLDPSAWRTESFPTLANAQWMFCLPTQSGLVLGSKGKGASIGLLRPPAANPRDLAAWTFEKWYDAGWIMSLELVDLDRDGDLDVLASDRYGQTPGILWFENPGPAAGAWKNHRVATGIGEPRFCCPADLTGAGRTDVLVATPADIVHLRLDGKVEQRIPLPDWTGRGKAVTTGDIDGDGKVDLVFSCENAGDTKSGVVWIRSDGAKWIFQDISGPDGIKYDRVELLDLDGDKDLDVLTTEERHSGKGLGIIWYENPRH